MSSLLLVSVDDDPAHVVQDVEADVILTLACDAEGKFSTVTQQF